MPLDYFNTLILICSMCLLFVAAKQMLYIFRYRTSFNAEHNILYVLAATVTVSSIVIGFFSLGSVSSETNTRVFLLVLLLSTLLVTCLQLLSKTIKELVLQISENKPASSNIDSLTGVYDRHYIERRIDAEVSRYKRYSAPLSLLTVNIVDFHHYNTVYGYQAGDKVLKALAAAIKESVRDTDIVARYKADQFVIVLTNTPEGCMTPVINRLRDTFTRHILQSVDGKDTYTMLNVKFGNAWCSLSTRSGEALVNTALEPFQSKKALFNKGGALV